MCQPGTILLQVLRSLLPIIKLNAEKLLWELWSWENRGCVLTVYLWSVTSLCLIKHLIMKVYGKMEVWLHVFLILALDEVEWSAWNPRCFTPWEWAPRYPLNRRLDGTQSWSWLGGLFEEEKNLLPLPGIDPLILRYSACSLITIPTELSWFPVGCFREGRNLLALMGIELWFLVIQPVA
jgi:hypothetical protein